MADDDKKFEAALAGFLHREKRDSERHVFCPEPELLAAYHDGTLSPEEIQVARLHVEGCSRCQEVLAHLKTTEDIPLSTAPEKLGSAYSQPLTFPGSGMPVPSRSRWRWIAPAGAIAASLVLWFAYQQGRSTKLSSRDSVQVAENRREAYVPPVAEPPLAPSNSAMEGPARQSESKSSNKMERSASPEAAPGTEAKTRETGELSAAKRPDQLSDAASESRAVQEFSTDSALSAADRNAASPAAAPAPAANAGSAKTAQAMDTGAPLKKKKSAQLGAANALVIIHTPDASTVWRVGTAGSIEISIDGGSNWHSQISGVTADLHAGSAPLANICWVVGRSGTILLTTDSGATWRKIKSPTAKALAGVMALDSLNATVWDISNEKFQTADGGTTWNRGGSE
ncbi:MAG TPA: zf-HC2 domain-containing protein [Candidatus Dormibacteraeota bacterium]|nr:zf-HC2 domain-containing protein [Candidatus Dormibacteraeota bacterium]